MKKFILLCMLMLIVVLPASSSSYDDPAYGNFGFQKQYDYDGFQEYVGKNVMYLPSHGFFLVDQKITESFESQSLVSEEIYKIIDIKPRSGEFKGSKNDYFSDKITIVLKDRFDKKIKVKTYARLANDFPLLFIDDFESSKATFPLLHKSFSDPILKGCYEISDVKIAQCPDRDRVKEIAYVVKNNEIHDSFVFPVYRADNVNYEKLILRRIKSMLSGYSQGKLAQVLKITNNKKQYLDINETDISGKAYGVFEDNLVCIAIRPDYNNFIFSIQNRSDKTLKVLWDEATYVNPYGSSSKIIHKGIRYINMDDEQTPSTIISGSFISDIALPTCNVHYSNYGNDWIVKSLLPDVPTKETSQVRLMLPIRYGNFTVEYVFIFDVNYKFAHPENVI